MIIVNSIWFWLGIIAVIFIVIFIVEVYEKFKEMSDTLKANSQTLEEIRNKLESKQ